MLLGIMIYQHVCWLRKIADFLLICRKNIKFFFNNPIQFIGEGGADSYLEVLKVYFKGVRRIRYKKFGLKVYRSEFYSCKIIQPDVQSETHLWRPKHPRLEWSTCGAISANRSVAVIMCYNISWNATEELVWRYSCTTASELIHMYMLLW